MYESRLQLSTPVIPNIQLPFPIKHSALFRMIADLIHRSSVIESAVFHHVMDGFGIVDIIEWVFIHDNQIREFARLKRAEIVIEPDVLRAV